jgi:ribosomal-protein-alanine N-acetyltransferase
LEGLIIRDITPADLPDVHNIEKESFTTPWSITSFEYELREHYSILKVAVLNNMVVGYICVRTMLDITHILNLAVTPKLRREGIGSRLLNAALDELEHTQKEVDFITLEVRESSSAVKLYQKHGFRVIGKRNSYYSKPAEDAVLMGLVKDKVK